MHRLLLLLLPLLLLLLRGSAGPVNE